MDPSHLLGEREVLARIHGVRSAPGSAQAPPQVTDSAHVLVKNLWIIRFLKKKIMFDF